MKRRIHTDLQPQIPRLIDERKPLRPVHVAAARRPIKVTKPIVFGGEMLPARRGH